MTKRHYTYELFHTAEIKTRFAHNVRLFIAGLIIVSIISVMFETVEEIHAQYHDFFYWLEFGIVCIFSIEYLLRLWSIVEVPKYHHPVWGRIKYMFTFMALIDLLAILPFCIPHFVEFDLRFLRGFRLVRLLRVVKLGQYSMPLKTISTVLHKKKHDIVTALFIILLLLIISSSAMYFLEHEVQPKVFTSIPASLWWGINTLTTIGYGDVVPVTIAGKICSAIISMLGIGAFALPSGIIVSGLIEEMHHQKEQTKALVYCPYCNEKLPH
ncbi:MAG TPA: ion transporter [Candidatus Kapabacteria bacterium]|nr:ion transporter [Candidatus Kapabacteria bacterium]